MLGPNRFNELTRTTPSTNVGIDPNIRQSYTDQILLGIERQLFPDFSLVGQYINQEAYTYLSWRNDGRVVPYFD